VQAHQRSDNIGVNLFDPKRVPLLKPGWKTRITAQALSGGFHCAGGFDGLFKDFYESLGRCNLCIERAEYLSNSATGEEKLALQKRVEDLRKNRKNNALTNKINELIGEFGEDEDSFRWF